MAEVADEESLRAAQGRIQPFLDCLACLLARRWLRDQRQEPPPGKQPSDAEPRAPLNPPTP